MTISDGHLNNKFVVLSTTKRPVDRLSLDNQLTAEHSECVEVSWSASDGQLLRSLKNQILKWQD